MFDYTIYTRADEEEYQKACNKVEKAFDVASSSVCVDVDGSVINAYTLPGGEQIKVFHDYYIDAVYVKSEVDLSEILRQS